MHASKMPGAPFTLYRSSRVAGLIAFCDLQGTLAADVDHDAAGEAAAAASAKEELFWKGQDLETGMHQ